MLLLVEVEGARWLADVGFGADGLLLPVPLGAELESRQFAWTYRVKAPVPAGAGDAAVAAGSEWVLQSQRDEVWTDLYGFTLEPQLPVDYEIANHYTSTHPESRFVTGLTIQSLAPERRIALRNRELIVDSGLTMTTRTIASDEEMRRVIEMTFGLPAPADLRLP